jgi:hypothetical protein
MLTNRIRSPIRSFRQSSLILPNSKAQLPPKQWPNCPQYKLRKRIAPNGRVAGESTAANCWAATAVDGRANVRSWPHPRSHYASNIQIPSSSKMSLLLTLRKPRLRTKPGDFSLVTPTPSPKLPFLTPGDQRLRVNPDDSRPSRPTSSKMSSHPLTPPDQHLLENPEEFEKTRPTHSNPTHVLSPGDQRLRANPEDFSNHRPPPLPEMLVLLIPQLSSVR